MLRNLLAAPEGSETSAARVPVLSRRPALDPSVAAKVQFGFRDGAAARFGTTSLLRRLADAPVAPENFIYADVRGTRLGPDQPMPAAPDEVWPERPA